MTKAVRQQKSNKSLTKEEESSTQQAILPHIKEATDKIGRVLRKHNIKVVYEPPPTIGNLLGNSKDKTKLENHWIYSIALVIKTT